MGILAKIALTFGMPAVWLSYAHDARELADVIGDAMARQAILEIADDYEKKAERARARVMGLVQGGEG